MAASDDRQARLTALSGAVTAFAQKRRDELNLRVTTAKALLKGRTGSDSLARTAAQGIQAPVINEINAFLSS